IHVYIVIFAGSGIFISPTGVYRNTQSVGLCLLIWTICGLTALAGALVYAELGLLVPKTGGDYSYYKRTFGNFPAFWYVWSQCLVVYPVSNVIKSLTIAEYAAGAVFDECGPPELLKRLFAITLIVTFTIINVVNVDLAARIQVLFATVKIGGLAVIAGSGLYVISKGKFGTLTTGFSGSTSDLSDVVAAMYSGIWAFSGWQTICRTLPLSIVISMVTVLVLYVMVNISYFVVLTPQEFMSSWAVGITWGDKILGRGALFVPIVVACSVFGSACEASFSSARIIFAGARDGNFVEFFSFIDVKSRIPTPSIFLVSVLSLAYLLLPLKVGEIINMMGFLTAGFNALTMVCHIVLRFNIKDASVPLRVPILVSFLLSVIYIYLFIAPLLNGVKKEIIFPVVFMSLGAVLYIPFILLQFKLPGLGK
ncbi:hypothetical protein FSP39_003959, partial [Pinctada imbricata]